MSAGERESKPSDERLRQVFNTVEPYVENRYGIPIVITDVPSPFTGDLDGATIHVDYAEDIESAVFIVAHLFGHTVQWNLSQEAREIGYLVVENPTEELLGKLHEYEVEACRYSLRLLHDAGVTDLDQWLANFAACDFRFLRHFYSTGERKPFLSFWQEGESLLEPLDIPAFRPQSWTSRWQGIVV